MELPSNSLLWHLGSSNFPLAGTLCRMSCRYFFTGLFLLQTALPLSANEGHWPQWRGPQMNGIARSDANPPVEWSESKNVQWKVKIPGNGSSSPIIWGDKVFITTAVSTAKSDNQAAPTAPAPTPVAADRGRESGDGGERKRRRPGGGGMMRSGTPEHPYEFWLLCLERSTGKVLWQRKAQQEKPHEGHHQDHGFASHSPVTDGERVYAYFGSRGLHCYDLNGKHLWSKTFGQMQTRNSFGEGSSPALGKNVLIINWDHEGDDFVAAVDKLTGEIRWKKEREEPTSWSTPLIIEHDGKEQAVVSATNSVRSYDTATGEILWQCTGMTLNVIPTPLLHEDVVYLASGFRGSSLMAVKLGASGDLTGTDSVLWTHDSRTPYVPSPVLVGERVYFFSGNSGMLTSLDAKTGGVKIDAERVPELPGVYASPVATADRIYLTGRNGEGIVIKPADKLEVIATNRLDDRFDASPAIVENQIFLRGQQYLYCLSQGAVTQN